MHGLSAAEDGRGPEGRSGDCLASHQSPQSGGMDSIGHSGSLISGSLGPTLRYLIPLLSNLTTPQELCPNEEGIH